MLPGLDWGRLEVAKRTGTIRRRVQGRNVGYEVEVWDHGHRHRIGTAPVGGHWVPLKSRELAQVVLDSIRADIAHGASVEQAVAPFLRRPTPASLVRTKLTAWCARLDELEAAGDLSPTTRDFYKRFAKPGAEFSYFDGVHIFAVRYALLEDWRTWLGQRRRVIERPGQEPELVPLSARTIAHAMGTFRTFLRWLYRRGDLPAVPPFPPVPQTDYAPTIATTEAQRAILAAIPEVDRGIFLAMAHTLRPGEARAVELRDYRDGDLLVRRACKGTNASAPVREAKERNWRIVAVDEELRDWIERRVAAAPAKERLEGRAPIFPNPRAREAPYRYSHSALHQLWKAARREAGAEGIRLYEGTKHTTSTDLLRSGRATIDQLQRFLGHRERRSTERYARLAERDVAELFSGRKR